MHFTATYAVASAVFAAILAAPAPEAEAAPFCHPGWPQTTYVACNTISTSTKVTTSTRWEAATETSTLIITKISTVTEQTTCPTGEPSPPLSCINEEDADKMADVFRLLIQEYSDELALATLTEDFVDYSSAVNIIMNKGAQFPKNITGPTFAGRRAFMDGQGSQPQIPFERLQTFHGCDSVSLRWMTTRSANGQASEVAAIPVIGNAIMNVVPAEPENTEYNWRIKTLYSEFNAAAWLVNLGVFVPDGPVTPVNNNATVRRSVAHVEANQMRGNMI